MVEALDQGDPSARYWSAIKRTCEELADHVAATVTEGEMPLVLGGDHSIAIGTLGGLARVHGAPGGVLWLDAHTDINSPTTSPSGNVHGMPMAVALGLADDPRFESSAWPLPMIMQSTPRWSASAASTPASGRGCTSWACGCSRWRTSIATACAT